MKKNILFIETTHKREYLYKAKELGYNIIVAEKKFDNHDNIADYVIEVDIHNYDELITKIVSFSKEVHISGVVTVHEHAVEAVSFAANALGLPALSIQGAINCRNKFLSRCLLEQNHIRHPRFSLLTDLDDLMIKKGEIDFPIIVKPLKYSGSSAVIKINDETELDGIKEALNIKRKNSSCNATLIDTLPNFWMIEEFMEGFEISVQAITWDKETHVIAIHDKVVPMNGPEFAEEYILTPSPRINKELENKIILETKKILDVTKFDFGVSHVEFRIVNEEPILIEVNGRIGGGTTNDIVFHSTGIDLFKSLIDISVGNATQLEVTSRKCVAVKRIQLSNGVIKRISGFDRARNVLGVKLVKQWMEVGEEVKTVTRDVGGAVLAVANTTNEALNIVENAVNEIEFIIDVV